MPTLFLRVLSAAEPVDEGFTIGCEWLIVEDDGRERAQGVADYRGIADVADPNVDSLLFDRQGTLRRLARLFRVTRHRARIHGTGCGTVTCRSRIGVRLARWGLGAGAHRGPIRNA